MENQDNILSNVSTLTSDQLHTIAQGRLWDEVISKIADHTTNGKTNWPAFKAAALDEFVLTLKSTT